ncbi:hypothetical protein [Nocardioides sp. Iso805N]|uniref:hypothetical protein n=1 Tax=Nocardioides sp. Iso805N TaxID=1283287 RepID=UPI00036F5B9F|nr:hypothetical protein [Nocardioides sp. Iso805N]
MESLVEAARSWLLEWGMECSVRYEQSPLVRADATLALRWGGARQRFAVHALPAVRLSSVLAASEAGAPVLVVAPWISPRIGGQLRAIGVAYVDSVGNASVRFGTVLIEVSGRKRPSKRAEPVEVPLDELGGHEPRTPSLSSRERSGRLLTPANRRVIAALLADPALEAAPLRELAEAAGVSVGQAHKSVTLLAGAGYHRGRMDARQRAALAGVLDAVASLGE